jgi:glycosyltransferase involved in cell wall biosynthesis
MDQTDILVSPRIKGTNTPMKIYSYMDSGKAVLATDLPTHRQALTDETAMLCPPDTASFAAGLTLLLMDPELRARLGKAAGRRVREKHSFSEFKATVHGLYADLEHA